uniref:DUF1353 domain-containing protein n=1 Tax=Cellvibrio fontiphilus TaxID=1815559 RepID=UPI002B4BFF09|nr:DUF1353 domain-containing protein [Cellvibrio fontiphilus]
MDALLIPLYRGKFQLATKFTFGEHEVPKGFITDLDSVPRIPIFYLVFKGRTTKAAIVHDFLYTHGTNRKEADKTFLELMELERVRRRYRVPIYWAVRIFGGSRYNKKQVSSLQHIH